MNIEESKEYRENESMIDELRVFNQGLDSFFEEDDDICKYADLAEDLSTCSSFKFQTVRIFKLIKCSLGQVYRQPNFLGQWLLKLRRRIVRFALLLKEAKLELL